MSSRGNSPSEIHMGRGLGSRSVRRKRGAGHRIGEVEGRPRPTPSNCFISHKTTAKKGTAIGLQEIEKYLKQIDCENGELLQHSYITILWKCQRSTYLMALLEDLMEKRYTVGGAFDLIRDRAVYDLCRNMTSSRDLATFQHLSFLSDKLFDKELSVLDNDSANNTEPLTEDNSS